MKRYLAELIGTYFLVLIGTGAVAANHLPGNPGAVTHVGVSLCFGLIVAVLIYAIGPVSGCHINPAVTISLLFAGKFKTVDVLPYLTAQCLGATVASATVKFVFAPVTAIGVTSPATTALASLVLEFLMTALLLFVIMQVADGSQLAGITAGAVIGGVIALEALFGGPLSGASMNPARSLGPALFSGVWTDHWVYWAGPLLGGVTGVLAHWALKPEKA